MADDRVEEAALESIDETRLLHGENPETTYLEDATHWMVVYNELLGVKRDLMHVIEEKLTTLHEETRREVSRTDLVVLDAEMQRFAQRHAFWTRRSRELVDGADAR